MKITEIKYSIDGPMGITHRCRVIATDKGLEEARSYAENSGGTITGTTEKEVESVKKYLGRGADRFTTYFMDGANRVENIVHYSTGSQSSVTYS